MEFFALHWWGGPMKAEDAVTLIRMIIDVKLSTEALGTRW